jgi:hypothetical protein
VVSDKERSRIEEGIEDSDNGDEDTHSTVMPTLTNCPSMDPFINSHTTSMLELFMDNNDASAMCPSNKPCSAPTDLSTLETEPFLLTSEPTRAGRKRKCRDMSNLSLCLCGISVQSGSVGSIQCQRAGCETVWVSDPFWRVATFYWNLMESIYLSIIYNALGMPMWVQESGLVTHVC